MTDTPAIAALRAALEAGPTPGPWRWEFNRAHKSTHIVGGRPMFDLTVMDFARWGMSSAVPLFRDVAVDGMNIMHRLCDRTDWIAPFPNRRHHADWCAEITHPDARLMVAAVNSAPELLSELDRLRAELAAQTTRADIASECAAQYGAERDRLRAGLETASRQLGEWAEAMRETVAERDRLAAEVAAVRSDFSALQHAIVGNTGASAILSAAGQREDAERYRWLRAGGYSIRTARSILNDTPPGIDAAIDAARAATAPSDLIADAMEFMRERATEQAEKDAEYLAAGRCPDCEGVGMQGGQFCGGYWTCERCGGSGNAAIAKEPT